MISRRNFITSSFAIAGASALAAPVRSILAARGSQYSDVIPEGPFTASDYVQDGLLTQFDAIENVGYGEHDATSNRWYDLKSGAYVTLPEGSIWRDRSLLLPNTSYYYSTTLPYVLNHFYETGQITQFLTHETISLDDTTGATIFLTTGSGGGISISPAWGKMNIWNKVCSYSGASEITYPNYPGGITKEESRGMIECAGWINHDNESLANGFTAINGKIVTTWDNGVRHGPYNPTSGCPSWIYYQCKDKTSNLRMGVCGQNELWKSWLVYDRILTDEERAWNLKVSKARFGV